MRLLLLLVFMAVALVAQAPAWLVAGPLRDASSGSVELRRPSGSVWNGAADLALLTTAPASREASAGRIAWSVRRIDPSTPSLTIELNQVPANPKPLTIVASTGGHIDISGTFRLPLQAIGLVPMLAGWAARGEAIADTTRLQWNANASSGNDGRNGLVAIRWTGARLVPPDLPEGLALGDASGTLTVSGGATTVNMRSTGGDVDVALDAASRTRTIAVALQPQSPATPSQLAWLQTHTMSRTPSGGFRIDAGWP